MKTQHFRYPKIRVRVIPNCSILLNWLLADPKQQDFQNNETLKTQISNELVKAVQNKLKQQTLHDFIHESNKPTRHTTFEKRSRTLALKRDADLKRTCLLVVGLADMLTPDLQLFLSPLWDPRRKGQLEARSSYRRAWTEVGSRLTPASADGSRQQAHTASMDGSRQQAHTTGSGGGQHSGVREMLVRWDAERLSW